MSRIKLVHFTSSLKIGGAEKVLFDLITHLDHAAYEQAVIFIHDGPYRAQLEQLGIPTYSVRGLCMRYDPWILIRLWRLLKVLKPNVLHTLLWSANVAGRLVARCMGIPCVTALHNNCAQNGFVRNGIDKLIYATNKHVIAVSQEVAQSAVHHTWVPARRIQVINNGIALNHAIVPRITRSMLGLSHEHFIIGSVGRFHPVKRYDLLLKIYAQIHVKYPHTRLLLLGVGELEQELRQLAATLGVAHLVTFVIAQPAQDYYHLFDCFVQTSAQEGISIALLEAMSWAVPSIVMHTGLVHSVIVSGETGLVVNAQDKQGCMRAIELLLNNRRFRTELGQKAQADIAKRFTLEHMIKAYDVLFRDMVFMQK